jgi:hypothetical protein
MKVFKLVMQLKRILNQDMTAACWVAPKTDSSRNQNQF